MSLKKFLQQKGFIEKDGEPEKNEAEKKTGSVSKQDEPAVEPTYFPLFTGEAAENKAGATESKSFVVTDSAVADNANQNIDPAFVKFFEDELTKTNFAGPDYFEFRKQMQAMYQKIGKGTSPHIILQAVLTSFEAQNIPASKLLETAKQYKDVLEKKKIDFLKGAAAEKEKQLKKRQDTLQTHEANLSQMQNQLQQLKNQEKQLLDMIKREQTQVEVNKTLGKESIEKIERAEKQISLAHNYMIAAIDTDISQLHSANH